MCAAYMMYGVVSVAPSYLFTSHTHTLYREREREMDQQVAARAPMDPKVAVEVEKYRDLGGRT